MYITNPCPGDSRNTFPFDSLGIYLDVALSSCIIFLFHISRRPTDRNRADRAASRVMVMTCCTSMGSYSWKGNGEISTNTQKLNYNIYIISRA